MRTRSSYDTVDAGKGKDAPERGKGRALGGLRDAFRPGSPSSRKRHVRFSP